MNRNGRVQFARIMLALSTGVLVVGPGCGENSAVITTSDRSPTVEDRGYFGDDIPVDVAIYFRHGVSDEEITQFQRTVLMKPSVPERRGQSLLDGVQYKGGDYERGAVYLTFFPDASNAQRQAVIEVAQASPLVERIALDVIPSEAQTD